MPLNFLFLRCARREKQEGGRKADENRGDGKQQSLRHDGEESQPDRIYRQIYHAGRAVPPRFMDGPKAVDNAGG